ncbi:MAG: hypothetical protein JNL72_11080 [Flavipsychrobacter sp.]|nr:hypothetical protein [Flavipsychrobacter sp.]
MLRYLLLLFITLVLLTSCEQPERAPFTTGSQFVYATSYTSSGGRKTQYDTLVFTIQERDITTYSPDLKKIKWENTRHNYYQFRGLNTKDGIVALQLPINYRGFDQELIAVAGHPTVSLNQPAGYSLDKVNTYTDGYGLLTGRTITQRIKDVKDTSILFDGVLLDCRQLQSHNISPHDSLGQFILHYTYNPAYGFITLNYQYPSGKRISMRLIDVSITGR